MTSSHTMAHQCGRTASTKPGTPPAIHHPSPMSIKAFTRPGYVRSPGRVWDRLHIPADIMPCVVPGTSFTPLFWAILLTKGHYSSYFLSTATNNVPGFNNFCASLMTTVLTNVYSAPSLTDGPIPLSPKLITLTTAQVSSTTVYADVIQISWASSNTAVMSLMKQQSATATSRSAAIPGSSTTGVPAATSPGSSFSSPEGMSTGAKIAIGVTIPTTIILMATVAAITFLYRRRRKKSVPQPDIPMQDTKDTQFHELHPDYLGQSAPTELDAAAVMELPGTDMRVELGIGTPTANSKMVEYFSPRKRTPRGTPDETPGSLKKDSTSLREI